ncbi:GtrA family protein [Leptolyngbya sp. FACHB-711]|nr:GtrA family protein [Leptolyngbya sp. FACHB-711]
MFSIFFTKSLSSLGKLFKHRIVRFLICGIISAAFNTLLLAIPVKSFSLGQPAWRNLANFISIEILVLFSFAIYRLWVWSSHNWPIRKIFRQEIPLYHLSCSASIAARDFILFLLLD